ncbi:14270_t:CDS:2 [Ambispora leptoticha]|uniref:14270_t:CDS:1 n=1 Tax=Ambispora leptoticha TaxID=144679 RepID=A0A9N9DK25_9GLOM|nr:14270_t:CDS:2 [Ambispora leptoticha]
MFDLSSVESNYSTFVNQTRNYLTNCLIGNAHLTGEGSLLEYFDEIIEEVIERGEIAIIEYPNTKEKFLAIPRSKNQNLLREPLNLEFQLLDNSNIILDGKEVEKLVNILIQMEKEIFMNEKGIMVTLPQWPDDEDVSLIMKSFSKKPFFFMCLPKSQQGNPKEGKLGIAPHQIKTEF